MQVLTQALMHYTFRINKQDFETTRKTGKNQQKIKPKNNVNRLCIVQ